MAAGGIQDAGKASGIFDHAATFVCEGIIIRRTFWRRHVASHREAIPESVRGRALVTTASFFNFLNKFDVLIVWHGVKEPRAGNFFTGSYWRAPEVSATIMTNYCLLTTAKVRRYKQPASRVTVL